MAPSARSVTPLVGRDLEIASLQHALLEARCERGHVVLVRGEAGVGKTRLVSEVVDRADDALVLEGLCWPGALGLPYLPVAQALRAGLRGTSAVLNCADPPGDHLPLLLPELGRPPGIADPGMLVEAVASALRKMSAGGLCVVFLDDLQWADHATLQLLTALAPRLERERVLVIGAYRDEPLPRGHGLRSARAELRRMGKLHELRLGRFDGAQTAALVEAIVGADAAAVLAAAINERAEGLPFFVAELAHALAERLEAGDASSVGSLPIPESVSDAVLAQAALLSKAGRNALGCAAAMGLQPGLEDLCVLGTASAVDELVSAGFLEISGQDHARFHHALVRDAAYGSLPWAHRRAYHRRIAGQYLAAGSLPAGIVAEQWLLAGEPRRARPHLLAAAQVECDLHAYRDAALTLRIALETWPEEEDSNERAETVERLGRCAELAGDIEAAVAALRRALGAYRDPADVGRVHRALAGLFQVRGDWDLAITARLEAADAFCAAAREADAAAEWLAAASHLQSAGNLDGALRAADAASRVLGELPRVDLRARALALQGQIRAKLGEARAGVEQARDGLALALAGDLSGAAADAYYRLASAIEHASDYRLALEAYEAAFEYCKAHDIAEAAQVCFACLAPVMRQIGEWDRAIEVCREVIGSAGSSVVARMVAAGELGLIQVARGIRTGGTRARLAEAFAFARENELFGLEVDAAYGLARLDQLEGQPDRAADRLGELVRRCGDRQEGHYSVSALRWSATFFALRGEHGQVGACARVLSRIAEQSGTDEATAGLACVLGEIALLREDAGHAVAHFERALEALRGLTLPLDSAEIRLRAGVTLARAGERTRAVDRLTTAYRTAKKLGARPLTSAIVGELANLGEKAEQRLGRRGNQDLRHGGLSRRELEVVRLVAQGHTNPQIARELFLSPRTVDTHVRSVLVKLGCRTRTEAAQRVTKLGLL